MVVAPGGKVHVPDINTETEAGVPGQQKYETTEENAINRLIEWSVACLDSTEFTRASALCSYSKGGKCLLLQLLIVNRNTQQRW